MPEIASLSTREQPNQSDLWQPPLPYSLIPFGEASTHVEVSAADVAVAVAGVVIQDVGWTMEG